jgi:hypothetical protein
MVDQRGMAAECYGQIIRLYLTQHIHERYPWSL